MLSENHTYIFIQENAFEYIIWKMAAISSWPQCVKGMSKSKKWACYDL